MAQWDGKSGGTLLGYKIFVFFIKKAGVRTAYFVLYFVALHYFLFARKSNKAIFSYFRERLKYSWLKAKVSVYGSYLTFGKTLIDKVAINAGLRNKLPMELEEEEPPKHLLPAKKGGGRIVVNAGNFEGAKKSVLILTSECKIVVLGSYPTFGETLSGKGANNAGTRNKFTYEFDGIETLKRLLADKKGGVLISAHIGNFEVAEKFFADIDFDMQINLVTTD